MTVVQAVQKPCVHIYLFRAHVSVFSKPLCLSLFIVSINNDDDDDDDDNKETNKQCLLCYTNSNDDIKVRSIRLAYFVFG